MAVLQCQAYPLVIWRTIQHARPSRDCIDRGNYVRRLSPRVLTRSRGDGSAGLQRFQRAASNTVSRARRSVWASLSKDLYNTVSRTIILHAVSAQEDGILISCSIEWSEPRRYSESASWASLGAV